MSAAERVVLLIGSGKPRAAADETVDRRFLRALARSGSVQHSTSESLGTYLLERLGELGFAGTTLWLHRCLASDEGRRGMVAAIRDASLVALAFPLYWDAPPAAVTRALELIAEERRSNPPVAPQRLVAVANCGFPEASQNETALGICRQFAREAGLAWAGGLAVGGGAAIGGRPLAALGRRVRHVAHSLELTAAALAAGQPVPPPAVRLAARPIMRPFLYRFFAALGWRRRMRAAGTAERVFERPYAR